MGYGLLNTNGSTPHHPLVHLIIQTTIIRHPATTTGNKPLTSPNTNLVISPGQAIVAPNVLARSQVLEFRAATTRCWEAAERQWREARGHAWAR